MTNTTPDEGNTRSEHSLDPPDGPHAHPRDPGSRAALHDRPLASAPPTFHSVVKLNPGLDPFICLGF